MSILGTCQECLHHKDGMCNLRPRICFNYDHFERRPMVTLTRDDFEKLYISRAAYDELNAKVAALQAALDAALKRAEAAEAALREAREFHTRAMRLIDKRKNFVVVAEDEPYFLDVYMTIRDNEQQKARWTDEDEQQYHLALLNASWNLSQKGGEE